MNHFRDSEKPKCILSGKEAPCCESYRGARAGMAGACKGCGLVAGHCSKMGSPKMAGFRLVCFSTPFLAVKMALGESLECGFIACSWNTGNQRGLKHNTWGEGFSCFCSVARFSAQRHVTSELRLSTQTAVPFHSGTHIGSQLAQAASEPDQKAQRDLALILIREHSLKGGGQKPPPRRVPT